jgi:hypothetical protein
MITLKRTAMGWGLPVLLLLAAGLPPPARADEKAVHEVGHWYPTAETGLNLTQSSYSDNWSGGDKGSVVWSWIFNGTLKNQFSEKVNWSNELKLAYGQTHQQVEDAQGRRAWGKPEKSTDLIDFETIFRFTLGGWVDPYASGRFQSLFEDASDPLGRTLSFNPLKFQESAGIARQFIDEENRTLLIRLGLALRQSARRLFVDDTPGSATRTVTGNDGGLEWTTDYKTKVLEDRVTWTAKLTFYKPLFYSGHDDLADQTGAQLAAVGLDPNIADYTTTLDIDWENIFTTQITKLISVNLYVRWVYDKYDNTVLPELNDAGELSNVEAIREAVRKAGQFKQTLALGITYRFL